MKKQYSNPDIEISVLRTLNYIAVTSSDPIINEDGEIVVDDNWD